MWERSSPRGSDSGCCRNCHSWRLTTICGGIAELRQPADVVLVEVGQHRSSPIGEVVADGLQPGGERIAGADVEAREAVVEDSGGAAGK
jgi:hypothetical protein